MRTWKDVLSAKSRVRVGWFWDRRTLLSTLPTRVFGEIPTGSNRKGGGGRRGFVGEGGVDEEEAETLSRTLSFELSSAENIFTDEKEKVDITVC
jgi:hypothetical protein